jgi:hypothetical protein
MGFETVIPAKITRPSLADVARQLGSLLLRYSW